jgi:hypothetical protein
MEDKDNLELPDNLRKRTGLSRRKVSPKPEVMIKPTKRRSFAANLYMPNKSKLRIFGVKPENIMDRYRYESGKISKASAAAAAAMAEAKRIEQQKRNNALKGLENLRLQEHMTGIAGQRAAAEAAEIRRQKIKLAKNAGLKRGFFSGWGDKSKTYKSENIVPVNRSVKNKTYPVVSSSNAPVAKKPWWKFFGGRRGTRKNRSRKNHSRKNRSRRN